MSTGRQQSHSLPDGWRWARLGDLVADGPTNGYSPRSSQSATGTLTLRLSATTPGRLVLNETTTKRLDEQIPPESDLWLRPGDLLVQRSNTAELVGTAAIYDGPHAKYVYPDLLMRLRFTEPTTGRWVWRFLNSTNGRRQLHQLAGGSAGNMPKISGAKLLGVQVPVPPLPEQRRIAALLDKADAIRRKRQQAIRLADDLLRSAFLDMFGDPVTNPKGWPLVNAGALFAQLDYGTSEKCSETPSASALPVLRIPNITNGEISLEELKYATLQEAEARKLRLSDGDLLFVRTNGNPDFIGRCAVFEAEAPTLFASYLIRGRLRPDCEYRSRFLRDVVSAPTYRSRLLREARTTAGNYNISAEGLRRLRLIVPPLARQDRYLKLAARVAATRARLADLSTDSGGLFHALIQQAFRAEV